MENTTPIAIFLANPTGVFYPGQIISGRVVITLNTEEEVRGVIIKLEGKATVQWSEKKKTRKDDDDSSDDEDYISNQRPKRVVQNSVTYVDMKNYYRLGGGGERGQMLPRGETSYAFRFQLPETNLPCSFNGKFGKIQYYVKGLVQRSFWKIDYETKTGIQMNCVVDLNKDPSALLPGEWKASKKFGVLCCVSGPVTVDVRLARRGYCPQEVIAVQVAVENSSNRRINNVTAKFVQETRFVGGNEEKKICKVLRTRKWGECVDAGESGVWKVDIKVPSGIPPTGLGGCEIIDVKYFLKIETHVFGMAFNLKQDCQIIVGTVPLMTEGMKRDETCVTLVAEETQSDVGNDIKPLYPDLVSFGDTGVIS